MLLWLRFVDTVAIFDDEETAELNLMGHRANYAIRQDGKVSLYYSHWGALTVPEDVFWGPESAEKFIRENEPVASDDWLDEVWAEGGVALDRDTKTIALFGGEALGLPCRARAGGRPLGPVFEELMCVAWARWGWKVRWVYGICDIAEQVGLDRSVCESDPRPPEVFDFDEGLKRWREESCVCGILSVRTAEGWQDRAISLQIIGLLGNGPSLLERFDELPTLTQALSSHSSRELQSWEDELPLFCDVFHTGAVFDVVDESMSVWAHFVAERDIRCIREQWEGWVIDYHHDLCEHFLRTGRLRPASLKDPEDFETGPEMSEDEALAVIAKILIDEEYGDPTELVRREVAQSEVEDSDVEVERHALKAPVDARPDRDIRCAFFNEAVAQIVRKRAGRL